MLDPTTEAILYALAAGIIWGVVPTLLKKGMAESSVTMATLWTQYWSLATLVVATAWRGEFVVLDWPPLLSFMLTGVAACLGKVFLNLGIDSVGASKSVTVKNSSPLITVLLGWALLGEQVGWEIGVGVMVIVVGVLLLTVSPLEGEGAPNRLVYFMYPLWSSLAFGINPIFKKWGLVAAAVPALGTLINHVTATVFLFTGGPSLGIHAWRHERVPLKSFVLFAVAGVTEALASICTYKALLLAPAVLVAPIWRISPLITFVLSHFTLRALEAVTPRDGLAALLIVAGVWVLSHGG
ncbi:MAG: EamA family transporter [Deltaproteobacteria bacterium]|nr:EamA family transporter [Deltaproteobacteria bacterium]